MPRTAQPKKRRSRVPLRGRERAKPATRGDPPSTAHDEVDAAWISRYPTRVSKILVSMPDHLVTRIDKVAASRGVSRSTYLQQLVDRELAQGRGPGAQTSVRAAIRRLQRLAAARQTPGDSTETIRAMRDAR